jgi:tRNA threonylcarbamoyladenosine biosynthesis protein TsaE
MKPSGNFSWKTASAAESMRLGESIGRRIDTGLCASIVGPLGAGKTVLVGGICRGLGVSEEVLSPTFVLLQQFDGRLPVAHVDLYRLDHEKELDELGVFGLLGGDTVILAEWADRSDTLTAHSDVVIEIVPVSANGRRIELSCTPEVASIFEGVQG